MKICTVFITIYVAYAVSTTSRPKGTRFEQFVKDYQKACPTSSTKTACCGYCSRETLCPLDDVCCFDRFESLGEALGFHPIWGQSKSCVHERYDGHLNDKHRHVVPPSSSAYWMTDHCRTPIEDLISVKLCQNPGMNNHFLSVVPIVNGGIDEITFRNKYCSECYHGKKPETNENYWDLKIQCDKKIEFNHENLMHVVQENKCKLVIQPPLFASAKRCNYLGDYTISNCNVTGLWKYYDDQVDAACHSFLDPFNKTYRNYFCYLCNTGIPQPPEQWSCGQTYEPETFEFSIKLSTEIIGGIEKGKVLGCDPETQFIDIKQVILICDLDKSQTDWFDPFEAKKDSKGEGGSY